MILMATGAIFSILLSLTGMAAFVAGVVWLKRRRAAQRSAELQRLAADLGLSFIEKDTYGLIAQLHTLGLFRHSATRRWSRNGKVINVMRGQIGNAEVYLFDYSYIVSTGKSAHEVRQTVFFANDKNWYLPNFRLRPETWWHKVLVKLGLKSDINFPESPDFSSKFWLTSEFEGLVRQQFSPDLQQLLTERPPVHLEGSNYYLIAYKPGKSLNADEAQVFFEHCSQLVRMLQKQGAPDLLDLAELNKEPLPDPISLPRPEKRQ